MRYTVTVLQFNEATHTKIGINFFISITSFHYFFDI